MPLHKKLDSRVQSIKKHNLWQLRSDRSFSRRMSQGLHLQHLFITYTLPSERLIHLISFVRRTLLSRYAILLRSLSAYSFQIVHSMSQLQQTTQPHRESPSKMLFTTANLTTMTSHFKAEKNSIKFGSILWHFIPSAPSTCLESTAYLIHVGNAGPITSTYLWNIRFEMKEERGHLLLAKDLLAQTISQVKACKNLDLEDPKNRCSIHLTTLLG
jgi:hypothetical protein